MELQYEIIQPYALDETSHAQDLGDNITRSEERRRLHFIESKLADTAIKHIDLQIEIEELDA